MVNDENGFRSVSTGIGLRALGLFLSLSILWFMVARGILDEKWWLFRETTDVDSLDRFGDLVTVASWIDCAAGLRNVSPTALECSNVYPSGSIAVTRLLGLSSASVEVWGIALAILVAIGMSGLLIFSFSRQTPLVAVSLALVALSPVTSLMLERGNLDSLLWVFVLLALILNYRGAIEWATGFVILGVLVKIYPAGILLAWLAPLASARRRLLTAFAVVAVTIFVVIQTLIGNAQPLPQPVGGTSFGAAHIVYGVRLIFMETDLQGADLGAFSKQYPILLLDRVISLPLFLIATYIAWRCMRRLDFDFSSAKANSWFLGIAGITLLSYIAITNFDYRLTFCVLLIFGFGLLAKYEKRKETLMLSVTALSLGICTWMSTTMPTMIQILGDGILWCTLSIVAAISIRILSQALPKNRRIVKVK